MDRTTTTTGPSLCGNYPQQQSNQPQRPTSKTIISRTSRTPPTQRRQPTSMTRKRPHIENYHQNDSMEDEEEDDNLPLTALLQVGERGQASIPAGPVLSFLHSEKKKHKMTTTMDTVTRTVRRQSQRPSSTAPTTPFSKTTTTTTTMKRRHEKITNCKQTTLTSTFFFVKKPSDNMHTEASPPPNNADTEASPASTMSQSMPDTKHSDQVKVSMTTTTPSTTKIGMTTTTPTPVTTTIPAATITPTIGPRSVVVDRSDDDQDDTNEMEILPLRTTDDENTRQISNTTSGSKSENGVYTTSVENFERIPPRPSSFLTLLQQRSLTGQRPWSRQSPPLWTISQGKKTLSTTSSSSSTTTKKKKTMTGSVQWKVPKWVKLVLPPSPSSSSSPSHTKVDELAFSHDGVLLAVAHAGGRCISIYDWDTIQAADQQGRATATITTPSGATSKSTEPTDPSHPHSDQRHHQHDDNKETKQERQRRRFAIPPILSFSTPYPISRLIWNPTRPDQLAVGFKVVGITRLYELDKIVAWQQQRERQPFQRPESNTWSNSSDRSRSNGDQNDPADDSRYPPSKTYTELKASSPNGSRRSQGTVSALVFFKDWIIMSVGNQVLGFLGNYSPILQWTYQQTRRHNEDYVTCITALYHKAYFLLATHSGRMIVLDADRRERTALSLQDQPVVVHEWQCHNLHGSSTSHTTVASRKDSTIVNLHISVAVHGRRQWMYVIATGWVCKGELFLEEGASGPTNAMSRSHKQIFQPKNVNRGRGMFFANSQRPSTVVPVSDSRPSNIVDVHVGRTQVLHSPPKVAVYNAQGESIGDDPHAYSTPVEPMVSHFVPSCSSVLFSNVPQTSKHLGHHDKYIVDYQPKLVRDMESLELRLLSNDRDPTTIIPMKELPQTVVMHPSGGGEWMVMGTRNGLVLMVNRRW